jgi:hypothetical protein
LTSSSKDRSISTVVSSLLRKCTAGSNNLRDSNRITKNCKWSIRNRSLIISTNLTQSYFSRVRQERACPMVVLSRLHSAIPIRIWNHKKLRQHRSQREWQDLKRTTIAAPRWLTSRYQQWTRRISPKITTPKESLMRQELINHWQDWWQCQVSSCNESKTVRRHSMLTIKYWRVKSWAHW